MPNNNHFDLTLDTLAPSGSITRPAASIKQNANLTINKGDATYMKVWFNDQPTGTKQDAAYPANPEAAAITKMTEFSANGRFYYHMTLIDDVGNESGVFDTDPIIYDTKVPTVSNVVARDPDTNDQYITNNKTGVKISFDYSDVNQSLVVSGVVKAYISGTDVAADTYTLSPSSTSYNGTFSFVSGVQDGPKTINIQVEDAAGNVSTIGSAPITLDTDISTPTIVLQTTSGGGIGDYINFHDVKVNLTSGDTDIAGYKIWEGAAGDEPSTWETTGIVSGDPLDVLVAKTLSSGDGQKTIRAVVKDSAGSTKPATPVTVTIDTVAPGTGTGAVAVSISSTTTQISRVTGYDTCVLSLAGTDVGSGVASWDISRGGTSIAHDTGAVPATRSIQYTSGLVEGLNTLTLTVTDAAGNSATDTFDLTVDLTAPTATVGSLATWYNDTFDVSVTLADTGVGVAKVAVWSSTTQSDTAAPNTPTSASAGTQTISKNSIYFQNRETATNYIHVKVIDAVGNVGYGHSAAYGFDSTAPTCSSVAFSSGVYASRNARITITVSDGNDSSGVVSMRVTGDITDGTANNSWETFTSPRDVTLTTGDGMKTVSVQVKDAAGNVSTVVTSSPTELDTTTPTAQLALYNADGSAAKPSYSPVPTLSTHISVINDDPYGGCEYLLYGDFTYGSTQEAQGITEANAQWHTFIPDSGQSYMTVDNMICTSGDGQKYVYVKIRDNAGHVSSEVSRSFTYDTTAPEVNVTDVDYNRISKVQNTLRRNSGGTIAGKYVDTCIFVFEPAADEYYQAFKVCAYLDQAAARNGYDAAADKNAWVAAQTPIPTTGGSSNMTGSGLNQNTSITATIKGADYETALGGAGNDGAHIVVVYIQDLGGTWSEAATFSA